MTELLVQDIHLHSLHPGPSILHLLLAESYFVVGARHLVKAISQHCIPCQKTYQCMALQMMGQLPEARVNPSPPFSATGIDCAGPFITKRGNPRKPTRQNCISVCCLSVSARTLYTLNYAVLSTSSRMAAHTRFVARCGLPHSIYSDNGTNFVEHPESWLTAIISLT